MSTQFLSPVISKFPAELKALPRWVTWSAEGGKDEKPRKVPRCPKAPQRNASSTDPTTWGTFEEAAAAYQLHGHTGLGFVLNGDGISGVDIDHCIKEGTPEPAAIELLSSMNARYIEVSPSGTGLRAFGISKPLNKGAKGKCDGLDLELYSNGRYLTLTGQTLLNEPLMELEGFHELAEKIQYSRLKPLKESDTHLTASIGMEELVRRVHSGDVFHDSLRDIAASMIANGTKEKAATDYIRALMKCSEAPKDDRWRTRFNEIPELVKSAVRKFSPAQHSLPTYTEIVGNPGRYKLLDGVALAALPPIQWRVKGILPATGLAAIYGPSGSGKSFLGFDLAASIAEGSLWFNKRVEHGEVIYAALEGESGFKLRAQAWVQRRGRPLPPSLKMLLEPFKLSIRQDVADLAAAAIKQSVVFIDTLNRAAPTADENSSKDMGEILEAAKYLQAEINGLVVLVHHTGKDTSKGARGHSSLFAALDSAIEVSRSDSVRSWKVAKSKDGEDGSSHTFILDIEDLGHDTYGDTLTSCVVEPAGIVQHKKKQKLGAATLTALRTLEDLINFEGITPPKAILDHWAQIGEARMEQGTRLIHEERWRLGCMKSGMTEAGATEDSKRRSFSRARMSLLELKRVGCFDGYVWIS
ncbi:hypothetical protein AEP_00084 [Curvibacter sp. AEP1-3]|uniref:AAA family ATPase n=1 Tax=Curvibacter sp. AEP1-3 TaxID=1844971 RepID=UPI000B3C8854|nr:AAA family ATPase [Curvibacter sp. AEP1-3]ARV17050.1 hypothetical protein AEP_00084 [Curvibacter sp. AEP1-3]